MSAVVERILYRLLESGKMYSMRQRWGRPLPVPTVTTISAALRPSLPHQLWWSRRAASFVERGKMG